MSSEVLILFIFRRVANLGGGNPPFVRRLTTSEASGPEILIIATPATPGPEDNAYIVI